MIVNRTEITHVNLDNFALNLEALAETLLRLRTQLGSDTVDMELINQEFMSLWTGQAVDDLQSQCRTLNKLLKPFKAELQKNFQQQLG